MATSQNQAVVAKWFFDIFSEGKLEVADQVFDPSYQSHDAGAPPGGWPRGPQGAKAVASTYRAGFPDLKYTVEDQVIQGDKIVTRWTARGTNTGSLMGAPPTGRSVMVTGMSIERLANGKIVETWVNFDGLGLFQQLGLIPVPGTSH